MQETVTNLTVEIKYSLDSLNQRYIQILQVPITTLNLVTKKLEIKVEPTYQPIICVHIFQLFLEGTVGPTKYCYFSRGHLRGHHCTKGPKRGHFRGVL